MIKNSRQHESNPPPKPTSIIHAKVGTVKHNSNLDPSLNNNQQRSLNIRKWNNDKWSLPSRRQRQQQQQQQQQKGFTTTKTDEVITLILGSTFEIPLSTIKPLPIVFKNADYQNHSIARTILPHHRNNSTIMGSHITESNFVSGYNRILRNNETKLHLNIFIFLQDATIAATTTATASSGTASCSISTTGVVNGNLTARNVSASWISIERNFTASSANSTLIVIISATNTSGWLLDDLSVEDSGGNEVLSNGNFENGTVTNGWLSTSCTGVNCGAITSSGCNGGSTECFQVTCNTNHALQQMFPTTPGNMYIFSLAADVLGSTSSSISISYSIT
ncbi:unnamed protein product [Rotaria magnacalcarata]|uniref:Uncharacterized protein n=1 Tax=Rotaria magnacalcarata TaxID=392030 RepID=A0A815TUB8_9BILA|nr:unnamed protein product [Rotaria magnacalcarata]